MAYTLAFLRQQVKDVIMGGGSRFEDDSYIDARINAAIQAAYPHWYTQKTSSFSGTSSTFEYTLSTDAAAVTRVLEKCSDGTYHPITQWEVLPAAAGGSTTKVIRFYDTDHASDTLSYEYICSPATLSSSTSSTHVHPEFIVNSAAHAILFSLAQQESDPDLRNIFLVERDKCEQRAAKARVQFAQRHPPTTVKGRRRPR